MNTPQKINVPSGYRALQFDLHEAIIVMNVGLQ